MPEIESPSLALIVGAPVAVELAEADNSTAQWIVFLEGRNGGDWVSLGRPIRTVAPGPLGYPGRRLVALGLVPGFAEYRARAVPSPASADGALRLTSWAAPVPGGAVAGVLNLDNPAEATQGPPGPQGPQGPQGPRGAPGETLLVWGATSINTTTANRYLDLGQGSAAGTSQRSFRASASGRIKDLYFVARSPGVGAATITYTVLINGIPALSLITSPLSVSAQVVGVEAPIAAGDSIALLCEKSAAITTSPADVSITTTLEAP